MAYSGVNFCSNSPCNFKTVNFTGNYTSIHRNIFIWKNPNLKRNYLEGKKEDSITRKAI
jgi:hypothetical protein